jgi:hypothetical protein
MPTIDATTPGNEAIEEVIPRQTLPSEVTGR